MTAPKDYGAVAREKATALGRPLASSNPPGGPGTDSSTPPATGGATPSSSNNETAATVQRQRQQRDSARSSKLFAGAETARSSQTAEAQPATSVTTSAAPAAPASPASADAQDRKAAFVTGGARTPSVNGGQLTAAAGRYVVTAGSTIAAALITGLSSDLPGEVVAQVTEDVFDSTTGRTKLILRGRA